MMFFFFTFSGVESKAVQPLLKKEAKKGGKILKKLGDIDNEKEFLDQINDLEFRSTINERLHTNRRTSSFRDQR